MANIGKIETITDSRAPETLTKEGFIASLELYIGDIIGAITVLAGLFFIVYAFLAAFQWVTAGDDSGKVEKAKNRFVWGTLGLILIVASYAIIGLIGSLIGISILEPGTMLNNIIRDGSNGSGTNLPPVPGTNPLP
jgi:hypothetical protein